MTSPIRALLSPFHHATGPVSMRAPSVGGDRPGRQQRLPSPSPSSAIAIRRARASPTAAVPAPDGRWGLLAGLNASRLVNINGCFGGVQVLGRSLASGQTGCPPRTPALLWPSVRLVPRQRLPFPQAGGGYISWIQPPLPVPRLPKGATRGRPAGFRSATPPVPRR